MKSKIGSKINIFCMLVLLSSCAAEQETYAPKQYGSGSVVAVWDLEDLSVEVNNTLGEIEEFMTGTIIETLQNQGHFELIERQKLLLALEELSLGSSELAAESSRLRVGEIIGAQLMVFGAFQLIGEQLRIDLRMVEVESGAVVNAAGYTTRAADIAGWLKAAEEAAMKLLQEG